MVAISIVNAKKNYGRVQALKGIDLQVEKGEFFGLLGPNGAGKTTLIHSIVGLCRLGSGKILVHGKDVVSDYRSARSFIGFAPQEMNLDRFFSIRQILIYHAGFFGVPRNEREDLVDQLLEQFDLTEKRDIQYYRLSGGMQKRLLIAKAVVSRPSILILDEPTAGVDVEQRRKLWDYLGKLNKNGTTIILTTHYIDEAEALCRRIGIIHQGEIREMGVPSYLIDRYCEKSFCIEISSEIPKERFRDISFQIEVTGRHIRGTSSEIGTSVQKIVEIINREKDCQIVDIRLEQGSLEDVFLKVTGSTIAQIEAT